MLVLNDVFKDNMKNLFKGEYDEFMLALNKVPKRSIRFNSKKLESLKDNNFIQNEISRLEKVAWQENAYYLDKNSYFYETNPYFMAGLYYFQEASAMSVVNYIPLKSGMRVLDLCAAPGGKTLQIAEKLGDSGYLLSNDISVSRQRASIRNIEKFGLKNIFVSAENPESIAKNYPNYFDVILLDAPCSGEGMFAKDKKTLLEWTEESNYEYSKKQIEILDKIKPSLKENGYLMYSTCTFSERENELVIKEFLGENSDFELEDINENLFTNGYCGMDCTKRLLPHKVDGLGHFMALMKKSEIPNGNTNKVLKKHNNTQVTNSNKSDVTSQELDVFYAFCNDLGIEIEKVLNIDLSNKNTINKFKKYSEKLYYITDILIPEKSFRTIRNGLLLGEIKKGKFIPSQHFAMSISIDNIKEKIVFQKDDINLIKYLKGESIALIANKGYILLCLDNIPLSWGLSDGKKIKNKFKRDWLLNR